MAVAKIDSWLQGMLTLEPSGKRTPNDYTICFARIS